MARWTSGEIGDLTGRVVVVTGANSGLGLVSARELARSGAPRRARRTRSSEGRVGARTLIASAVADADLDVRSLDLASLASVREFATGVAADHGRVDILLNNAGVMMPPRGETADGFERQFGTNHLGHFALTGLLLDALAASGAGRVVTVSSLEHKLGQARLRRPAVGALATRPAAAYQRSKLANAVFGLELDRRLRAAGLPVISVIAHPGYSDTNLQSTGPTGLMKAVLVVGNRVFAQDAERGALPQLYAATADGVEGGQFFGPDGFREVRGSPTEVEPVGRARDPETGRRLWEVSEELTGVAYLSEPVAA